MAEASDGDAPLPKKKSKLPLIMGFVLALVLGGGGFYATFSGLILGPSNVATDVDHGNVPDLPDVAFVPVEPVIVALGDGSQNRHLKFTAQVEVGSAYAADVTLLLPRILDVFNSYLSAVDPASLEESAAIIRVRAQLLRRIQVVVGEGRVRDLLITEFVLN